MGRVWELQQRAMPTWGPERGGIRVQDSHTNLTQAGCKASLSVLYHCACVCVCVCVCARVCMHALSHVQLLVAPWTAARQAPLSMGFSRQEYWSGLPCPPPGDLCNPVIKPRSPAWQAGSLLSELPGKPIEKTVKGK